MSWNDKRSEHLRSPPKSIEAEQAVLGGIMLATSAYARICDRLSDDDFYRGDHQLIYRAIRELAKADQPFDAVTLGDWAVTNGHSETVSPGYLIELAATTPSAANIEAYADIVQDKARLRRLIEIGTAMVGAAFQPEGKGTEEIAADASRQIGSVASRRNSQSAMTMREIGSLWFEELNRRYNGETHGLITPWSEFNKLTGGLNPGDLMILAGRPGMGKSAAAINIALAWAMAGKTTMYFSLEMAKPAIYNRCAAALESIPLSWLKNPASEGDYWAKASNACSRLKTEHFIVDDEAGISFEQIKARSEQQDMRRKLSAIVIDHAHIVRLARKARPDIEIGEISTGAKALGKKLGVPVILLAQLNRSVEARANKRPMMADLREAGAFEQDADIIAFMYRDDYYSKMEGRQSQNPGMAEMILAKMREGETGTVWLKSELGFGRFDEPDFVPEPKQSRPRGNSFNAFKDN